MPMQPIKQPDWQPMRNLSRFLLSVVVITLLLFVTTLCRKNNDTGAISNADLYNQLTTSKWKVHYFYYQSDQTSQFSSYVFTFKTDSALSVTNGADTYNGFWYLKKDNNNAAVIKMEVRTLTIVQLLNSDWNVLKYSGTILELKEGSGTNADLHLIKQ
jgi:hypothetical protein